MKKILLINTVEFEYNGITKVIAGIIDNIEKDKYCIDVVACDKIDETLKKKMENKINKFYDFGFRKKNILKYILSYTRLIKKNKYDIIHVHGNSATMVIETSIAGCYKVRKIIAHSHNNKTNHPYINLLLKPVLKLTITDALACSEDVGKWLFDKYNFVVYKNGIDLEKYYFKANIRDKIRKDLGFSDELVIGHVGLFNEQKNQNYLLEVLRKLKLQNIKSKLLLIGHGNKKQEFTENVMKYGLKNDVLILENRSDVNKLLMGMDIFLFPSNWEGFGIALLEAQATGLPCIASTNVLEEVNVTKSIKYISLDNLEEWVMSCNIKLIDRESRSAEFIKILKCKGYDTKSNVLEFMEKYYC